MVLDSELGVPKSAHVIVVGNEQDGFGKGAAALHIAVGLMQSGQRVAAIDLDGGLNSVSHHFESRRAWSACVGIELPIPSNYPIGSAAAEAPLDDLEAALTSTEYTQDFVVISSPRADDELVRLAHSHADTVVTPLIDSFIDTDALGTVDRATLAVTEISPYAVVVRETRRQRRALGPPSDWIVLRERPTSINSENRQVMPVKLSRLAGLLGFRMADAICEPVIYRDLLPRGLTALDVLDEATLNAPPGPLHLAAQQEVRGLIKSLNLPLRPHRRQHADAYSARSRATARLLEIEDIFAA